MARSRSPAARCAAVLLALCTAASLATPLYRWVDANGVVHYSDTPQAGAERIEIATIRPPSAPKPVEDYRASPTARPKAGVLYTRLEVTSPSDGSTFSNIHTLALHAELEPALSPGHTLYFTLDGQQQPASGLATNVEIHRGEHTVTAVVVDETEQTIIASAPVTFSVHQASIATPPRGPLLQATPKS